MNEYDKQNSPQYRICRLPERMNSKKKKKIEFFFLIFFSVSFCGVLPFEF